MIRVNDHILFQGDSITNAFRKPEELCNAYQLGSGYAMIVASQLLARRPKDNLRFTNRGVSGEGVAGLQQRWQVDCLDLQPDILSILVGINDAGPTKSCPHTSLEEYEQRYRALLARTRTMLPSVRLVLCEPFALHVGSVNDRILNDVVARGAIVRKLAAETSAVLVPLQTVFADALKLAPAEFWSFDGIHPNAQGHWLIAEAWLQAVTSVRRRADGNPSSGGEA
ncbi:MAG: SGNH/GDSL hydrolase family protein [bacterium]